MPNDRPQSFDEYLAALNASLELGLRSRWRIFREVGDHLEEAAERELAAGASSEEAERRAIAAFGSPQEVAAGFESGLLGALDRRLALAAGRLDVWAGRHPWGAAALRFGLALLLAALVAGLGAALGANAPVQAAGYIAAFGITWNVLLRMQPRQFTAAGGREPGARNRIRAGMRRALGPLCLDDRPTQLASIFLGVCMAPAYFFLTPGTLADLPVWVISYLAGLLLFGLVARRVSRRDRQQAASTGWDQWAAEHPFSAVIFTLAPAQLALVAIALLSPSPLGLRVALVLLAVGIVFLVAVVVRLAQARSERQSYGRHYEEWSRSTSTGACRSAEAGGRDRDQLRGGSARALRSAFTTYGGS